MNRKNEAYIYIKDAILDNKFPQGTPLREVDIATSLKMSRSPVREALRDLESEGIVVSYPGRGTFVSTLTPYDVEEIYDLRAMLEEYALKKSFSRITPEDLDEVENNFKVAQSNFDWEQYHMADRALHGLIVGKCGNKRLIQFLDTLNFQVERIRRFSDHNKARTSGARLQEHLDIISFMRKGDLDGSLNALRLHLRNVADSAIDTCRELIAQSNY